MWRLCAAVAPRQHSSTTTSFCVEQNRKKGIRNVCRFRVLNIHTMFAISLDCRGGGGCSLDRGLRLPLCSRCTILNTLIVFRGAFILSRHTMRSSAQTPIVNKTCVCVSCVCVGMRGQKFCSRTTFAIRGSSPNRRRAREMRRRAHAVSHAT